MIQNAVSVTETPFISCHNESNTFCSKIIWKVIFCRVFCENASHYRPSVGEENNKNNLNKMSNLYRNSTKMQTKSRN